MEFLRQVGPKGWGVGRPGGLDGEKDTQESVKKLPFPPGYWDPKQDWHCGQSPRLSPRGPATGPSSSVTWGMAISPSLLEEVPPLKGLIGKKKVAGQNEEAAAVSDVKIRMIILGSEQHVDSKGPMRSHSDQALQSEHSICTCSLLLLVDLKGPL